MQRLYGNPHRRIKGIGIGYTFLAMTNNHDHFIKGTFFAETFSLLEIFVK
jgi:hypothetical protein